MYWSDNGACEVEICVPIGNRTKDILNTSLQKSPLGYTLPFSNDLTGNFLT
jgi:hypothetical protein